MEPLDAESPESRDNKEELYLNNNDLPNNRMLSPANISSSSSSSSSGSSSTEDMNISSEEISPSVAASRPRRSCCEKYNLRRSSLRTRVQAEEKKQSQQQQVQQQQQQQPARQRKQKSRPPPLSKYRRRSANARERFRMAEINDAFEELKVVLPQDDLAAQSTADDKPSKCSSSKNASKIAKNQPTKVAVLRLAINYIASLRKILGHDADISKSSTSSSTTSTNSSGGSGSSTISNCSGSNVNAGHLSDDLVSDAASTSAPSTSSCSGDDESLMSFEDMDMADSVDDLDMLESTLGADFSATLSANEEMCLELVASVL